MTTTATQERFLTPQDEDDLEEYLNNHYPHTLTICGFNYEQGTALRSLNPIAFREILLQWINV